MKLCLPDDEIRNAVTNNAVIDYNEEIAYSNARAIIQGGTGIYFGYAFDEEDNLVEKGSLYIAGIIKKIIIPNEIKVRLEFIVKCFTMKQKWCLMLDCLMTYKNLKTEEGLLGKR